MPKRPRHPNGVARKTLSVEEAGKLYFGVGRNTSYQAVKRGEIPAIKIGNRICVPIVALEKMLENAWQPVKEK